jgi:NAD(P)-dependent dehydrogenase (short-subunit alcohol dehydrogenase family)
MEDFNMAGKLEGKVAIVTGGASGIGRGIVERFVAEGAKVVIADLAVEAMREVAAGFGDAVATCEANVVDEGGVEAVVATAVHRFGKLDIAANCAFGYVVRPGEPRPSVGMRMTQFWEQDAESWKRGMEGALYSVFLSIKHESKQMVAQGTGGAIINISSINARQAGEGMSSYCASKAGVEMLVRCAAMELGPHKIRVTGIAPGLIETPATRSMIFKDPNWLGSFHRNTPLGRNGQPSDIAAAAAFLASEDGAWISGEVLTVDGGEMTREYPRVFEILAAQGAASRS